MSSHQPNILLIFVDNQPANMMGCYGNDEIFSPHLDDLASKSDDHLGRRRGGRRVVAPGRSTPQELFRAC